MGQRKSKELSRKKTNKKTQQEVYIIKQKRDLQFHDFLPGYEFLYENIEVSEDSESILTEYRKFLRDHEELVLDDYSSKDGQAITEGFARGIALTELFLQTVFLEEPMEEGD